MYQYEWLKKTLQILNPDIILIFNISTTDYSTWNRFYNYEERIELNERCDFAYRAEIQFGDENIFSPLVIGIPHLTQHHLSTYRNRGSIPLLFRALFEEINVEEMNNNEIGDLILDEICNIVEREFLN